MAAGKNHFITDVENQKSLLSLYTNKQFIVMTLGTAI